MVGVIAAVGGDYSAMIAAVAREPLAVLTVRFEDEPGQSYPEPKEMQPCDTTQAVQAAMRPGRPLAGKAQAVERGAAEATARWCDAHVARLTGWPRGWPAHCAVSPSEAGRGPGRCPSRR